MVLNCDLVDADRRCYMLDRVLAHVFELNVNAVAYSVKDRTRNAYAARFSKDIQIMYILYLVLTLHIL